jgi:signal transduction histidine kinase
MRRVLGVLRDHNGAIAPRVPLDSGEGLAKLLEGFRTAGLPLHYSHSGPSLPRDPSFQLTVYRIVQESLTNVLRYSRGHSRVDVSILRSGSIVTIEVLDDGKEFPGQASADPGAPGPAQAPGSGQGLLGMSERARIYGGTVEAGPSARGWRVRAVLSWPDDDLPDPDPVPQLQGRA